MTGTINLGGIMIVRALAIACAGFSFASIASAQTASTWPQRTVTLIVSQAAGASPDVMARLIADKLSRELGQGVIVENKPGGGNVVGAVAAARAAPDGQTFFFATSAALANNVFMMKDLPYDPVKDFAPVALVTRSNQVIVTTPDLPVKTLSELVALEKASPGKYSLGVDGPRNLAGVTAQALNKRTGTTFVLVPYPNINNAVQDTIAGRLQVGVFSVSIVEAQIRAGTMRAIAMASAKRVSAFPDLPAAGETIPGFDFAGWFMLMAPTGTPTDIVAKMNAAIDRATHDPQVREMAPKLGFDINPAGVGSPKDAANFLGEQLALWEKTTKELGIEQQ
jgi:tripartite-type tricarboxylate transporter receptor subunit TctC